MRVLTIVPAYNEAESLPAVIESLRATETTLDVLVVDDGSVDRSARIAREHGAAVISLPFNVGIGGAVQAGYLYAKERGYDVAVQVDADGQHPPRDIPRMIQPILAGEADLVAGSRFLPGSSSYRASWPRRVGILYFSFLLSLILGRKVTDPTSGFRAVNRQVILLFAREYPSDYPEVDSLVQLKKRGLRSREVPVAMAPRAGGRSSISWGASCYYMVKVTLSVFVQLLRGGAKFE